MTFNSLKFLIVFAIFFMVYWTIPSGRVSVRKILLLVASLAFYMSFKPTFVLVLLLVTGITYWGGIVLEKESGRRWNIAWLITVLALLPLLIFKYFNFINDTFSCLLARVGMDWQIHGLNWAVPIGISFFSFQAVGYMLDVYHRRIRAERNVLDYALFVSFFPQIVSGPISKAAELLPQIKEQKTFDYSQGVSGLKYLLWGMFLKVVLADRAGSYVDTVFADFSKFSSAGCSLAAVLYSFQIYADFAGYSFMAVGIGKLLGFRLINNFNRPYLSVSVTDFWRRWHISLSRWLKDYVYIPLGGSRCSKKRNYWNILVTFLVSGVWHGANWTFVIWGLIHGVCQIAEKALGWNRKAYTGILRAFRIAVTFVVVTLAWVVFRSPSLSFAGSFLSQIYSSGGIFVADAPTLAICIMALCPLLLFDFLSEYKKGLLYSLMSRRIVAWPVYLVLLCLIVLAGCNGGSFIYANF